jgi:hypothetical protein
MLLVDNGTPKLCFDVSIALQGDIYFFSFEILQFIDWFILFSPNEVQTTETAASSEVLTSKEHEVKKTTHNAATAGRTKSDW